MAQRIVIPGFRKIETSGGGEGGTSNYNDLTNKPSINNVPLVGNLKTVNLKLTDATLTEEGVPAEAKTVGELINKLNLNKANWEELWHNADGVTQGNIIEFNRKNYTIYAILSGNSIIYCHAPIGTTANNISCGTPVLLYAGSEYVLGNKIIMFDAYDDHFYISICADYVASSTVSYSSDRKIYSIYGIK